MSLYLGELFEINRCLKNRFQKTNLNKRRPEGANAQSLQGGDAAGPGAPGNARRHLPFPRHGRHVWSPPCGDLLNEDEERLQGAPSARFDASSYSRECWRVVREGTPPVVLDSGAWLVVALGIGERSSGCSVRPPGASGRVARAAMVMGTTAPLILRRLSERLAPIVLLSHPFKLPIQSTSYRFVR